MSRNPAKKQVCAWLSRHPPSAAQRRSLANYQIVQMPDRWTSAHQAWRRVIERCETHPMLIVVVMPEDMLCQFIDLAQGSQIVRPKMSYFDSDHWTGVWQRVYVYPKLGFQAWKPE